MGHSHWFELLNVSRAYGYWQSDVRENGLKVRDSRSAKSEHETANANFLIILVNGVPPCFFEFYSGVWFKSVVDNS